MQFQHLVTARPPVQAINVLGDQGEFDKMALHLHQGMMAGIRFSLAHPFLSPGIPFPNQAGIAAKRLGRG